MAFSQTKPLNVSFRSTERQTPISEEARKKLTLKPLSKKVTEMALSLIIVEKFGINALIKTERFRVKFALKKGVMSAMTPPAVKEKSVYKSMELKDKAPELYW